MKQKAGQLTIENDWLKKNLRRLSPDGRKRMVEKSDPEVSISKQTGMLDIYRTSV